MHLWPHTRRIFARSRAIPDARTARRRDESDRTARPGHARRGHAPDPDGGIVGSDARGANNLNALAAQAATKIVRARPAARRRSSSCAGTSALFQSAFFESLREKVAKDVAPRVDAQAQARVGRLADAQPGRREGGRGADELRPPRPDDLARVRMAAARARHLHGRAAGSQQRRRRPQPAARRDRRRGAARAASRRSPASARAAASSSRDIGQAVAARHARVLRRDPAPAPGARRPAGESDRAHRRGPGQPARRRQFRLRQPAARRPRSSRGGGYGEIESTSGRAATWTCSPRTGARWRRHSPADPRRWTASATRCPRRAAPTSRALASTPPPTSS